MTPRLLIKQLSVTGPKRQPAVLGLVDGLNVVQGAANTGKSHIFALINFLMGASSPPTAIPEQAGYDASFLTLKGKDPNPFTLCRMLVGGDFKMITGLTTQWPLSGQTLGPKHKSDGSSLSEYLLKELDMEGKRLRKNARGESVNLSFRHIVHLSLVPEGKIQSDISPVETGQHVSRTQDFSAFKYLLTGNDDGLLDQVIKQRPDNSKKAHQLELLDRQLTEISTQIERHTPDPEDLKNQDDRIKETIARELEQLEDTGAQYRDLAILRRALRKEREALVERNDEIGLLTARFARLEQHYTSDIARLEAIAEAGSFFLLRDAETCPMCGASPEHQHKETCEGDFEQIGSAAEVEIHKIRTRLRELTDLVARLRSELQANEGELPKLEWQLSDLDQKIRAELPDVKAARTKIDTLMSTRSSVQRGLFLVQRQAELNNLRIELGDPATDSTSLIAQDAITADTKDDFALAIQELLDQWGYPTGGRVFFDLKTRDIEIAGKPRKSNGKGVRAVLHAAFSIALARFCLNKQLPHPGFVILDSPLVTYRDPIESDEQRLAKSDLKTRFFESLRTLPNGMQVLIFENVDLPEWLKESPGTTIFTGTPENGRAGFYPNPGHRERC